METSSECSENSMLFLANLEKAAVEDNIPAPFEDEKPEKETEKVAKTEVPIGFGLKSSKKAETFSKSRPKEKKPDSEDVLNLIQPAATEDILKIIHEEKPKGQSNISISYDIGIEVFPPYALEYLKHKYNIV